MRMYSVKLRKKIDIPDSKIVKKTIKGRHFLVGSYEVGGKKYKAYQITK